MILKWMRFYCYRPNIENTTDKRRRDELKAHLNLPRGFGQKLAIFIYTQFKKMQKWHLVSEDEEKQTVEYHSITDQILDRNWDGDLERLRHARSRGLRSSTAIKPSLKRPTPCPQAQGGKRQRSGSVTEPNSNNATKLPSTDEIRPSPFAEPPKSSANRAFLQIGPNSFLIQDERYSSSDSDGENSTDDSSQPKMNGDICSDSMKENTVVKNPVAQPGVTRWPNNSTASSNRPDIPETSGPIEPILNPSLPSAVPTGCPSQKEHILEPGQPSGIRANSPTRKDAISKPSQQGGIRAGSPCRQNPMPDHNLLSAELEKVIANLRDNSAENGSKDDRSPEARQYKGELSILKGMERICREELKQKKEELGMVCKAYKRLVEDYSDLKNEIKRCHQVVMEATERNKFIVPPTPSGNSQSTFAQALLEVQKKTEDCNWQRVKQAEKLQLEAKLKVQSDKKSTLKTLVAEKTTKLKGLHAEIKEKKEQDARNRSLAAGLGAFLDEFMDVKGSGTTSPAESLSNPESELSDLSDSNED